MEMSNGPGLRGKSHQLHRHVLIGRRKANSFGVQKHRVSANVGAFYVQLYEAFDDVLVRRLESPNSSGKKIKGFHSMSPHV